MGVAVRRALRAKASAFREIEKSRNGNGTA
jgi:hypothetical protein